VSVRCQLAQEAASVTALVSHRSAPVPPAGPPTASGNDRCRMMAQWD
jgi:hypothetical protein